MFLTNVKAESSCWCPLALLTPLAPPAPAARGEREPGADGAARPGLPRVGVGDLAELVQDLVQQREVAGAQVGLPLREDLVECRRGYLDRPPAALLDHDQPGAAIRGVGGPADVPQALQLVDQ